jgi:hypothetical protein
MIKNWGHIFPSRVPYACELHLWKNRNSKLIFRRGMRLQHRISFEVLLPSSTKVRGLNCAWSSNQQPWLTREECVWPTISSVNRSLWLRNTKTTSFAMYLYLLVLIFLSYFTSEVIFSDFRYSSEVFLSQILLLTILRQSCICLLLILSSIYLINFCEHVISYAFILDLILEERE